MTKRRDSEPTAARSFHRLLAVGEIMERLQISRPAAYRLMQRLPGRVYIGKAIRVPEAVLESFLSSGGDAASNRVKPASIFSARQEAVLPAPGTDGESDRAGSARTKHWLSKLRVPSQDDSPRRTKTRKEPIE